MPVDARLRDRWRTREGAMLSAEVFRRLRDGAGLDGLALARVDGRLDLRGIVSPRPVFGDSHVWRDWIVDEVTSTPTINGGTIESVDFTGADLYRLMFNRTRIVDCVFDDASCTDWGMWATRVERSVYRRTDLRKSGLGALSGGVSGSYRDCAFIRADLRGCVSHTADYADCNFESSRLDKIDWQSSGFVRCRFSGTLREVIFWDHGFRTGKAESNPMEDVDFSRAELRWCEFRRLEMSRVRLPEDDKHLVIRNYGNVLRSALELLNGDPYQASAVLRGNVQHRLKWLHPNCSIGVFNVKDLAELDEGAGEGGKLLERAIAACGSAG